MGMAVAEKSGPDNQSVEEVFSEAVHKAAEAIYREDHGDWLALGHELPPFTDLGELYQRRYERFARAALEA